MFKHFDKDKSGRLGQQDFKSCLRALGYDLPMVEEGQNDPEFEAILDLVDPNRDGHVSLQEYMAFMISRETENVRSSEEVENAFRAIAANERPYVTNEELYQVSKCSKLCFEQLTFNILTQSSFLSLFIEPHERHGRVLHAPHGEVRGPEDESRSDQCLRLCRVYTNPLPELDWTIIYTFSHASYHYEITAA